MWKFDTSYFPYYIITRDIQREGDEPLNDASYPDFCEVYEKELKDFAFSRFSLHKMIQGANYTTTEEVEVFEMPM